MSCCTINITPFAMQSTTTVSYTGNKPTVSVAYLQPDGTLQTLGFFTQIKVLTTTVVIDHGGPSSGYIKLVQ